MWVHSWQEWHLVDDRWNDGTELRVAGCWCGKSRGGHMKLDFMSVLSIPKTEYALPQIEGHTSANWRTHFRKLKDTLPQIEGRTSANWRTHFRKLKDALPQIEGHTSANWRTHFRKLLKEILLFNSIPALLQWGVEVRSKESCRSAIFWRPSKLDFRNPQSQPDLDPFGVWNYLLQRNQIQIRYYLWIRIRLHLSKWFKIRTQIPLKSNFDGLQQRILTFLVRISADILLSILA
jgi:hypothetical protein